MDFTEIRSELAALLAPADETEPHVYVDLVDAVDVPCFMLLWSNELTEEGTPGASFALPLVIAVAGRIEPGETLAVLERMYAEVFTRTRADARFAIKSQEGPRIMDIGGISYLAARVTLRVAVTFSSPSYAREGALIS